MKNKWWNILAYALALAAMLLMLQWLEWRFLVVRPSFELYVSLVAVIFLLLGIWLAVRLFRPKTIVKKETLILEKITPVPVLVNDDDRPEINYEEQNRIGISGREMDVLRLMAGGYSNQEIASQLFVSVNTIKTHTTRLFEKMDVKRRTQAIEKAKRLRLIP